MSSPVHPAARRATAEGIGTATLVAAVVGSGIMATRLTADVGLQLLINAVATVGALAVLIWSLGPISGAHFNPAVTLVATARAEMRRSEAGLYIAAQILGALLGAVVAHVMFELPAVTLATKPYDLRMACLIWSMASALGNTPLMAKKLVCMIVLMRLPNCKSAATL